MLRVTGLRVRTPTRAWPAPGPGRDRAPPPPRPEGRLDRTARRAGASSRYRPGERAGPAPRRAAASRL